MKRLILITVLLFCTLSFFANEKAEALPETENAVPDFSIEDEQREIRRQERKERKALRKTAEYKMTRGHFMSFMGITLSVLSIPYLGLMIGYAYHVMPWWFEIIENMVISYATVGGVLGVPFVFIFGIFPILVCSMPLGGGIGFSIWGSVIQNKNKHLTTDKQRFAYFANKHLRKYRNFAIVCGVVGSCFIPMLAEGILLLTKVHKTVSISESEATALGIGFTLGSTIISGTFFSFMFGALGAMAWLKGEMNRFSVDIGLTSGNKGELSCDRSRKQQITPNGAAIALCVKF